MAFAIVGRPACDRDGRFGEEEEAAAALIFFVFLIFFFGEF